MVYSSVDRIGNTFIKLNALSTLWWLLAGGIFYTIGGIIYGAKSEKIKIGNFGFHEIFHIFILLGSLSHFICVFTYVL